jgi:ParB family transcriptional regulator, chromosome partitioning protein
VEVYDLSLKLTDLAEPGASITWAREIKSLNKNLLTPTIKDLVIRKVNEKEITNSKDIRKLRQILKDPVARQEFLSPLGTIEAAQAKIGPTHKKKMQGLFGDIEQLTDSLKHYSLDRIGRAKGGSSRLTQARRGRKTAKGSPKGPR